MAQPLTQRQTAILDFVGHYASVHGYPPTIREIAHHHGIKGISAVKKHLDTLARKGHLTRTSGARAVRLAHATAPRLTTQQIAVPILGQVAAALSWLKNIFWAR